MSDSEIPTAAAERLLKKAGGKRISYRAAEEFSKLIQAHAFSISKRAAEFAQHAGRRTVMTEDIRLARKKQ